MKASKRLWAGLGAALLALSACGGGSAGDRATDGGAVVVDAELIADAVDDVAEAPTARFEMAVTYEGVPGVDGATITGEGAYDREADAGRVAVDLGPLFDDLPDGEEIPVTFDGRMETITIGSDVYLSSGLFELFPGMDADWIRLSAEDVDPGHGLDGLDLDAMAPAQGFDPQAALEQLRAIADIEEVGREEIRGVATRHLRGEIRMADALEELDADEREALTSLYGGDLDALGDLTLPVDVYVDDQGLIRRMAQRVELGSLAAAFAGAGLPGSVQAEVEDAAIEVVVDYFDFGAPVDITAPSDAVDLTELFGGAFAGLDLETG